MACLARAGSATTSTPPTMARPPVGTTRVVSMPTVVVLPAPLGPSSPKISPSCTPRSRLSTALRPPGYTLVRPSVVITSRPAGPPGLARSASCGVVIASSASRSLRPTVEQPLDDGACPAGDPPVVVSQLGAGGVERTGQLGQVIGMARQRVARRALDEEPPIAGALAEPVRLGKNGG